MNLIESMMEPCVIVNVAKVPDGQGGYVTTYTDGAEINAAIINDTSMQARIGETQGLTATYTITTTRNNALDFHDIIKRKRDGEVFRVTSEAKLSPHATTLDVAQVNAEKWSIYG